MADAHGEVAPPEGGAPDNNIEVLVDLDVTDLLGLRGNILPCVIGVAIVLALLLLVISLAIWVPMSCFHMVYAAHHGLFEAPHIVNHVAARYAVHLPPAVLPFARLVVRVLGYQEKLTVPKDRFRDHLNATWAGRALRSVLRPGTCPKAAQPPS